MDGRRTVQRECNLDGRGAPSRRIVAEVLAAHSAIFLVSFAQAFASQGVEGLKI